MGWTSSDWPDRAPCTLNERLESCRVPQRQESQPETCRDERAKRAFVGGRKGQQVGC